MIILRIFLTLAVMNLDPDIPAERVWTSVGLVVEESTRMGLDPVLAVALGHFESKLDPQGESRFGYVGIMQTASRAPGWRRGKPTVKHLKSHPREAVHRGLVELADRLDRCLDDEPCAMCGYHCGPQDWCHGSMRPYARGVLWERVYLLNAVSGFQVGRIECRVEMRPDVEPPVTVAAQATLPVFGVGHASLPRLSQKTILDRLMASTLDRLRYGACREEFGVDARGYKRCIHARGRIGHCVFVE